MPAAQPVATRPGRAGGAPARGRRHHGPALAVIATAQLFVPLSLVALTQVRDQDSGLASSLLNTGQQVGGAIGLAALGTVAWTAVADSARSQLAAAARSGRSLASAEVRTAVYHHALAAGITRGFLAASGIALAALVTTAVTIRVRREDLTSRATAGPGPPARPAPARTPTPTTPAPEGE